MSNENEDGIKEGADWKAPDALNKSEDGIKEKIAVRIAQSFSSRLSEYLTGLKPEDPRMIERLKRDQEIIRAKYNLPNPNLPLTEFERALIRIAENMDVKIRSKAEFSKFFKEEPFAAAVHLGEGKISVDINRAGLNEYYRSLNVLEHELIHAIQDKRSRSMPIELMEYEAYVAGANIEYLENNPEAIDKIFFNFFVGISVNIHYRRLSEERGREVVPEWDNSEYFLKRDGIDTNVE